MPHSIVILPTYNEKENIENIVKKIFEIANGISILIVDDNSPDGTGEIAGNLAKIYKDSLFVIHRPGKLGLGTAYIEGFKFALSKDLDYIFQMDSDFSHNPIYIPRFLEKIKENDLVIGSRYIPGGGVENWGISRKIISRGGSLYARTILGLPFHDLTGGFRCFRREVLEAIDFDSIQSHGYSFQIELIYRVYLNKFRIAEIPIIFPDRKLGKSKMSKEIFIEALFMVIKLRLNRSKLLAYKKERKDL